MKKIALMASIATGALLAAAGMASAADLGPQPQMNYAQPAPVYTPGNWYARGDVGVGFADGRGGEAFTAGMGVGYRFSEMFRTDLTVDWTGDYRNSDAWTVMGNGYIDFAFGQWLKPYIGAGIGWGDVNRPGPDDDGLALAAYTGLTFDVAPQTELDLGYRYRTIGVSGTDFDDHALRAGLRYNF